MGIKQKNVLKFSIVIILIAVLAAADIFGIGFFFPGVFGGDGVRLGLDLVGGSRIVFEADTSGDTGGGAGGGADPADGGIGLADGMNIVKSMMRARLDALGFSEATIVLSGENRIIIEIPSVTDPEEAVRMLGSTAVLEFVDSDGNVVLEGGDVAGASAMYGDPTGRQGYSSWFIQLEIAEGAREKFADATADAAAKSDESKRYIDITLDGESLFEPNRQPRVSERISGSTPISITGPASRFTREYCVYLSDVISSGRLPFALREVQLDSVGPSLGDRALRTSLIAGGVGVLLVMLFMTVMYRLPGAISSAALLAYIALMGMLLVLFKINLTLPGIAGIILSVGMAVDANVIIFERIKEELALGRSTSAALKGGFHRAFRAILDSNITTLIAAGVLWYFGSGSIRGFAVTLFIGVLLSLFSALFITKFLLSCLVGIGITDVRLYGLNEKKSAADDGEAKKFSIVKYKKIYAIAVAVAVLTGAVSFMLRGFNLDTDFIGGTSMHYRLDRSIDAQTEAEIIGLVEEISGKTVSSFQRAGDGDEFIIKTLELETGIRDQIFGELAGRYGVTDGDRLSVTNVGASVSSDLRRDAVLATVVALILLLIYITIRFDLFSGLAAIICLAHDLFIMITVYSLLAIPMNGTMISALLTILGYSINATIIIFDCVRENFKTHQKLTFKEIVDRSITQTLRRSVYTTLTTLMTIGALYIVGVASIKELALPIIVGLISGLFSSVCLAGTMWAAMRNRFKRKS